MPFSIKSDKQTLHNRQIGLIDNVSTLSDSHENVSLIFGVLPWAFPELASRDSLARVANARPGVPDSSNQTWTLTQINQAKGLVNYYDNVGRVLGKPNINIVSLDTTLNWVSYPVSSGPWNDNNVVSTGILIFQNKTLTAFDNTWFGEEYNTLKQDRLNAYYQPYRSTPTVRGPLFKGQGSTSNINKYLSGLHALVIGFEVIDSGAYSEWRNALLGLAAAQSANFTFEILVDTDFSKDLVLTDGSIVDNKMFGQFLNETRLMIFGTKNESELQLLSSWLLNNVPINGASVHFQVEASAFE